MFRYQTFPSEIWKDLCLVTESVIFEYENDFRYANKSPLMHPQVASNLPFSLVSLDEAEL